MFPTELAPLLAAVVLWHVAFILIAVAISRRSP